MKKTIDISLNGKLIEVKFNKELKNHSIILTFEIVNPYQLICISIEVKNTNKIEISSTDIRKVNIHTLIKRGLKAIHSYKIIDANEFNQKTKGLLNDKIVYKNVIKDIKDRKIKDRDVFLSIYSYVYQKESKNYGHSVSKRLSDILNYSEGYIKNLTKESFNKSFISNNTAGVSGGLLTPKSIKILNSL